MLGSEAELAHDVGPGADAPKRVTLKIGRRNEQGMQLVRQVAKPEYRAAFRELSMCREG